MTCLDEWLGQIWNVACNLACSPWHFLGVEWVVFPEEPKMWIILCIIFVYSFFTKVCHYDVDSLYSMSLCAPSLGPLWEGSGDHSWFIIIITWPREWSIATRPLFYHIWISDLIIMILCSSWSVDKERIITTSFLVSVDPLLDSGGGYTEIIIL